MDPSSFSNELYVASDLQKHSDLTNGSLIIIDDARHARLSQEQQLHMPLRK